MACVYNLRITMYVISIFSNYKVGNLCNYVTSLGLPLTSSFPFYNRMMQSFRRYHDDKCNLHLVNAGKYASSILVSIIALVSTQMGDRMLSIFGI